MEYMRTLPDNSFDLAIVDPPYSKVVGNVERTGGTWAAKYGKSIKAWDIAPPRFIFHGIISRKPQSDYMGWQLFQASAYAMFPYLAQTLYL